MPGQGQAVATGLEDVVIRGEAGGEIVGDAAKLFAADQERTVAVRVPAMTRLDAL